MIMRPILPWYLLNIERESTQPRCISDREFLPRRVMVFRLAVSAEYNRRGKPQQGDNYN
jgi:hypothetical protein